MPTDSSVRTVYCGCMCERVREQVRKRKRRKRKKRNGRKKRSKADEIELCVSPGLV